MEQLTREKEYLCWLSQVPYVGPVTVRRLWDRYHSFEKIYNMEGKELKIQGLINARIEAGFDGWKKELPKAREECRCLGEKGIRYVTFLEDGFPKRLKSLYGAPVGLYVKGRLPTDSRPAAAIVGARGCSHYGRETARLLARYLAEE